MQGIIMKIWFILLAVSYMHAFPTLERTQGPVESDDNSNFELYQVSPQISSISSRTAIEENKQRTVEEFPRIFSADQWKGGSLILSFLIGIYCFIFLALICDIYFIPCIERICETLNLSQDIAAATFMAMATSAPEFFVNAIGTFLSESDIGIGTVVGSSLFNTLGVAALGSLAAKEPIKVDWWPVTRDCSIYIVSISMLVVMTWDSYIYWYEGMILFTVYFIYFVVMFNNKKIAEFAKAIVERYKVVNETTVLGEKQMQVSETTPPVIYIIDEPIKYYIETREFSKTDVEKIDESTNLRKRSYEFYFLKLWALLIWPLKFFLRCTVPNPKSMPKLFPLTFIMCIIFIGVNSYIVSWMISIIGHILEIPDVVIGLTFLAAGSCLPESISIIIMSKKGNGNMGVSNALGANSMNILLSLGLPWFIKTMIVGGHDINAKFIQIDSNSIEYTILGLTIVAISLFATLYFNDFMLSKRTGVVLLIVYVVFLCLAILSELLFFKSTLNS